MKKLFQNSILRVFRRNRSYFTKWSLKSRPEKLRIMKEKWNYIIYLVWFSYLVLSAVLMFGHGFLLNRKTLPDTSECVPLSLIGCDGREGSAAGACSEADKIRRLAANPGAPMACVPERHRVLFILVDALRYDFTLYDPEIEKPLPYQNRLPVMHETLTKYPERTRLFQFVADPPTTTLQRVKALATGSLPTFVDASSNFAAEELQEDSIIDQAFKNGGVVLLGDDTWERLLPGRYLRSHTLYSFHTWDLDTVDNEVDTKIYDELRKDDWNFIVAHYLGVDHAGHRYGPNHPEMTRKLGETDRRLRKIIEMLPPDVLLYVIGDHGMTETGDHGGESSAERTAALFAYRGAGLAADRPPGAARQTDYAATLCAALGRPPPAPSLGSPLFAVLPRMRAEYTLLHLTNSLKQITQYLVRYGEESQQISVDRLTQLINTTRGQLDKAAAVHTDNDLQQYKEDIRDLVETIRTVFKEVWVEFDSLSMLRALLLLLLAIFFNWIITEGIPADRIPHIFASTFVPTGVVSMAVCVALCCTAYYLRLLEDLEHAIVLSTGLMSGLLTCSLTIMHWDGISQRWYEGRTSFYERFARVALFASAAALTSNSYIIEEGAVLSFLTLTILGLMAWNVKTVKALGLWVGCGVVLGVSRVYRGCREEQGECWTSGRGAGGGQASRAALVLALGCMGLVAAAARRGGGGGGGGGWRGRGLAAAALLAGAHWAVGWGSLGSAARGRQLARAAWAALAVPLLLLWRRGGGAAAALCACALALHVAHCLALGAALAPAAALALLAAFLVLQLVSALRGDGANKFSLPARCSLPAACVWALLASYMFYGCGHHATLGHVRWAPAFHAGDPQQLGAVGTPLIAALVLLELFGMPLMFGAAAPLLVVWGGGGGGGGGTAGPRSQLAAVFSLCLKFALCFAIRMFAIALSATIHCRHLMVWGVFTPKLVFEAGACAAALLGATAGAALAARHLPAASRRTS